MSSMNALTRCCLLAAMAVVLDGCLPSSQGPLDEQKEMHFLTGKARENALDYKGAIEAFEKALEANPQNGSAHFELGLLCEKESDFSGAIYHFERFLKLRPNSDYSQIVRERINADKMELSKAVAFVPFGQHQREFEKLAEENKQLRAEVEKWRAYYNAKSAGAPPSAGTPSVVAGGSAAASPQPELPPQGAASASVGGAGQTSLRTHTVKAGDTPLALSRKYSVKLDSLLAVNPGLDPRKMKIGQIVRIPNP